jgi:chromosome partitioning protein
MKIVSIQNAKGGIGKTTTSIHVAAGFAIAGYRVLLMDTDPQASIKSYFKIKLEKGNTLDFIMGGHHEDSIYPVKIDLGSKSLTLDVMPSSQRMQDFDERSAGIPRREEILKYRAAEENLEDKYDVLVIDCPPTLNLAIKNVLTFTDFLLIPAEMEGMALTGIHTVLNSVEFIFKYTKNKPTLLGILPTKYDQRQKISKNLFENLPNLFSGIHIFKPIRIDAKTKKAYLQKKTLYECDPETRSSKEYLDLTKDLINRMGLTTKTKRYPANTSTLKRDEVVEL